MKRVLLLVAISVVSLATYAQWSMGLSGGYDYNNVSINKGYAYDVIYSGRGGFNVGVLGRYKVFDWLSVRADLNLQTRNYKMQRNLIGINYAYTNHTNTYLQLPIMADLSLGTPKIRGHLYLGGYVGYWIGASRNGITIEKYAFDEKMSFESERDNRFNAGLMAGIGVTYKIKPQWEIMIESFYMYDLTNSHKSSSSINDCRYNTTTLINVGAIYTFKKKKVDPYKYEKLW